MAFSSPIKKEVIYNASKLEQWCAEIFGEVFYLPDDRGGVWLSRYRGNIYFLGEEVTNE